MKEPEFIARIAPYAIENMRENKIAASLTISQAALESGWGSSSLTVKANNLFGIKGKGPAGSMMIQTTEYVSGKAVQVAAAFRAYNNWGESIADHSELIVGVGSRDNSRYSKVIGALGKTAALEIAAAGYATDPSYAAKLIQIMNSFNLYPYDDEVKEDDEMSAEDKQKLVDLETGLTELRNLITSLTVSKDTLKTGVQEQGQSIKNVSERLSLLEGQIAMALPAWAQPAVNAAIAAGLLDSPSGGSYDFYRILTVLNRAGLLITGKED
ncbi:glycoside hydrolase family 73 protein [Paenibacillus monticola]|uniref:Mannosyl-glycoprotein endo-beta-N-acetylglucosamidase n=1 Tax=Paenibacillus monticola TaxID=2666075 RepID=A0A7X2H9A7_9BACL|nr:glucosaminidase domain-containing protein [Paenibacillus monticola]MRN55233.1 mannosyl-glycoprotein endo-beta-N-acetylglucosamidase [Paenibacillus monticola]